MESKTLSRSVGDVSIGGHDSAAPPEKIDFYNPEIYGGEEYHEWLFAIHFALGELDQAKQAIVDGLRVNPLSEVFRKRSIKFGMESPR